jgi:hypothetical protein
MMPLGIRWFKQKMPYIRVPVAGQIVRRNLYPAYARAVVIELYKPTGGYNPETEEYEYVWAGWE